MAADGGIVSPTAVYNLLSGKVLEKTLVEKKRFVRSRAVLGIVPLGGLQVNKIHIKS